MGSSGYHRGWSRSVLALVIGLLAALPAMAQGPEAPAKPSERPAVAPAYRHFTLGVGQSYSPTHTTSEQVRADMKALKSAGISLLRVGIAWDAIEQRRGEDDWSFYDQLVQIVVSESGVALAPYVYRTPAWAARAAGANAHLSPPRDVQDFERFLERLVRRYGDRVRSWEIWDAPEHHEHWSGSPADYARLLRAAHTAIRAVDPGASVVCGGTSGESTHLRELLEKHRAGDAMDTVSLHGYYETLDHEPLESLGDQARNVTRLVERYGRGQRLWMTRLAYSTHRRGAKVSDAYHAYYSYEHTPAYQGVHLLRGLALLLASEQVAGVTWAELRDTPVRLMPRGEQEPALAHLGLLDASGAPKPAWESLRLFRELFPAGYRRLTDLTDVQRAAGSDSEVHVFETEAGHIVVMAWLRTHIPERRGRDRSGTLYDNRQETLTLRIPVASPGQVLQRNPDGGSESFTRTRHADGRLLLQDVTLRGGGITIIEVRPAQTAAVAEDR